MGFADLRIRQGVPEDLPDLDRLYGDAFPDEELRPLVRQLSGWGEGVVSLVAEITEDSKASLAGHVIFTSCSLPDGPAECASVALLGPLAVAPRHQRQGIGRALVTAGHEDMRRRGIPLVCVLGDPGYYGRLGFQAERQVLPPYDLPREWDGAWQSMRLSDIGLVPTGNLSVPLPWNDPALWAP